MSKSIDFTKEETLFNEILNPVERHPGPMVMRLIEKNSFQVEKHKNLLSVPMIFRF